MNDHFPDQSVVTLSQQLSTEHEQSKQTLSQQSMLTIELASPTHLTSLNLNQAYHMDKKIIIDGWDFLTQNNHASSTRYNWVFTSQHYLRNLLSQQYLSTSEFIESISD